MTSARLDVDRLPREARARFWEILQSGDMATMRRFTEAVTGFAADRSAPIRVVFEATLPERHLLEDLEIEAVDDDASWLIS